MHTSFCMGRPWGLRQVLEAKCAKNDDRKKDVLFNERGVASFVLLLPSCGVLTWFCWLAMINEERTLFREFLGGLQIYYSTVYLPKEN